MWWVEFCERQLGLITWDQGVEAAGRERFIHALRTGRILKDRPRVYVLAGVPRTKERDILSACLSAEAVASHHSAAWVERFPGIASLRPEITTGPSSRVRLAGVKAHRSTFLPPEHLTVVDGIPCTTPARTAVDMSAVLGDDSLERMLNKLHQQRIASYAEVVEVLGDVRRRGRRRVAHLSPILDKCLAVGEKSDSGGEIWAVSTLIKAGCRVPEQQIWVVVNGFRYCIDLGYRPEKVGIDFDGWGPHGLTRSAFDGDRNRISELALGGWLMLPVTSATPASVLVDRVQRALAQRRPTSGH
jgi:hypothetical protein